VLRAYEGMEGKKIKIREYKIKYNTSKISFFKKPKFHYKPTCEVGSVREEHISQSLSS
jgi:hypothetical protein